MLCADHAEPTSPQQVTEPSHWAFALQASLLLGSLAGSAWAGFLAGQPDGRQISWVPANYQLQQPVVPGAGVIGSASADFDTQALGRVQAELIELRVLYARLADIANLNDSEFDIDAGFLATPGSDNDQALALLKQATAHITEKSARMRRIFLERRTGRNLRLSGRPVMLGQLASGFGLRVDPLTGARELHRGIDYAGRPGEPVLALADGVVTFSGPNGGYGNMVELEHAGGYRTRYAHNDATLVGLGQHVSKGEPIATLGSTGRSTGPHVHLEVRQYGVPLDPLLFIR